MAKKMRAKRAPRGLSAQEACYQALEQHRLFECAEARIDTAEKWPPAQMINRLITQAVALCGFVDLKLGEAVATVYDQLIRLFDFFTAQPFGRESGWPVLLFLSPNVLRRTLEQREAVE